MLLSFNICEMLKKRFSVSHTLNLQTRAADFFCKFLRIPTLILHINQVTETNYWIDLYETIRYKTRRQSIDEKNSNLKSNLNDSHAKKGTKIEKEAMEKLR